jgi:hypothetical protein
VSTSINTHDTLTIKQLTTHKRKEILQKMFDNMSEAIYNPILIEDTTCYHKWYAVFTKVCGALLYYPDENGYYHIFYDGMTKETIEKINQKDFFDVINSFWKLSKIIQKRIIFK